MLSFQEWTLLGILGAAVALIITDRLRADLVAILVLAALPFTGLIGFEEALSGFSRPVVITIICLFILTEALEHSGVVQAIAERLRHAGRGSEARLVVLFMGVGALLSLVMNNIAAGAVLLPAAVQVGRESNVPPSKLLIPLSFGTLVGGMATYFTTANILMSTLLADQGQPALGMGDFLPTGGLVAAACLLFMALAGRKLLPARESAAQAASPLLLSRSLSATYRLGDELWEVSAPEGCRLAGRTLGESGIGEELGLAVLAVWRGHQALLNPGPGQLIRPGDYLLVLGPEGRVERMAEWGAHIGRANGAGRTDVDLTEIVIPPRSGVVGKSLAEIGFRNKYHLTAVALWRRSESYRSDVGQLRLEVGDALLMVGSPENIRALADEPDFLVLQSGHAARPRLPQKAPWVLGITAAVLAVSIAEIIPTAEAMLLGVAALALSGSINLDEAYRAISWRVVFLIAGMLPLSLALVNSGLADRAAQGLVGLLAPYGPPALIAGLFVLAMLLAQVIGGQVAALIAGPIAVTAALQTGVDAQAVAVAVAIACSAAYLTPIAHPVNVLMMSPGGYTARDFIPVGLGMSAVTAAALLVGMRLFWGV